MFHRNNVDTSLRQSRPAMWRGKVRLVALVDLDLDLDPDPDLTMTPSKSCNASTHISHHLSSWQGLDFGSHTLLPHSPRIWKLSSTFASSDVRKSKNINNDISSSGTKQRPKIQSRNFTRLQEERHSTTTDAIKKKKQQVRFSTCEIREYAVTLGDHPCCEEGAALTLDWSYSHDDITVLDATLYGFWQDDTPKRLTLSERKLRLGTVSGITESQLLLLEQERREQFEEEWLAMLDREYTEIVETPYTTSACLPVKRVSRSGDLTRCTTAKTA
mmetsp:Transcript_27518/g.42088  ORF Transcript_27518/g.42088 Transcript_27518/m.42088 type:complete len:273 (+) Transcript_27518:890-1708(+)